MCSHLCTKMTTTNTTIADNIKQIRATLPTDVTLLCVSKYHSLEAIRAAYEAGESDFGESRVQELQTKAASLPQDIRWHFIGHLQTNKIKQLLPLASLIHGIDSLHLLEAVSRTATKPVNLLLEVHIACEESKYGFTPEEVRTLFSRHTIQALPNIYLCGLMGMASLTENQAQIRHEFQTLKQLFDDIKRDYYPHDDHFSILSMGMSDDYLIAVEEGSTLVRIGTAVFGDRE